jgi:hypothetical protein
VIGQNISLPHRRSVVADGGGVYKARTQLNRFVTHKFLPDDVKTRKL